MKKIRIGKIYNTRGLRGELKVKPLTDFVEERFAKGNRIYIEDEEFIIHQLKPYKNGNILIALENMLDINLVEKYKNHNIYIDEDDREELAEGEYYISDLIGLTLYNQEGEEIGVVSEVMETGANSVLRVNDTVLIPFVDAFIIEVNLEEKYIKMNIIEGMI